MQITPEKLNENQKLILQVSQAILKINDLKERKRIIHDLNNFLECLTDREIAKFIYIISLAKISTTYEISSILKKSRTSVEYNSVYPVNAGLVRIITMRDKDYQIFSDYWDGIHPNTHHSPIFYCPTEFCIEMVESMKEYYQSFLAKDVIMQLNARGNNFTKTLQLKLRKQVEDDLLAEKRLFNAIGSCAKCTRILHENTQKHKSHKKFGEDLYCNSCVSEMIQDGSIRALIKRSQQ